MLETQSRIMKILVAGRGFLGKNIVEKLRDSHEVKTLDRGDDATFQQDITEEFSLEEDFDVLIHTVGLAPGMNSRKEYEEVHVEGTKKLLSGVDFDKIIFLSALKADEVDHSFFQTKKRAEDLIVGSGKKYTILRPSTVYGEGNRLLKLIGKAAPTMIFPDLKTMTQPIHVDDLVEIVEISLDEFDNRSLNLGGPEKMTIGQLAKKIYRKKGFPCFLIPAPQILQETSLKLFDPLPGPFNKENIQLLKHQNITEVNDAEQILGELKEI